MKLLLRIALVVKEWCRLGFGKFQFLSAPAHVASGERWWAEFHFFLPLSPVRLLQPLIKKTTRNHCKKVLEIDMSRENTIYQEGPPNAKESAHTCYTVYPMFWIHVSMNQHV